MPPAPHGHPFRLIDRAGAATPEGCVSVKVIGAGEELHDPGGAPGICPPALVVETLAQAALPLAEGVPGALPGMIVAMDRVRLHRPVMAGDRLVVTARIVFRFGGFVQVESRAQVEGSVVAEGIFTIREDA